MNFLNNIKVSFKLIALILIAFISASMEEIASSGQSLAKMA